MYDLLNNSVSQVVADKEFYQAENSRQQSMIQKFLFYDLIHGNNMYGEPVETQLKKMGYSTNYAVYRCVMCCFLHGKELSAPSWRDCALKIQNIFDETIPGIVESFELSPDSFLLIIGLPSSETEELVQGLQQANGRIREEADTDTVLAVGAPCTELSKLYLSFNEASLLCQYAKISDKPAVCVPETAEPLSSASSLSQRDEDRFSFIKIRTLLISAVMEGKTAEIAEILDRYMDQLLYQQHPPVKELRYIVFTLCGCIEQICDKLQMDMSNIVVHAETLPLSFSTIEEFITVYQTLKEDFQKIGQHIAECQNTSSTNLGKQLLKYVDENFTDASLCLSSLSVKFGVCESYISVLFKETAKVTFSNYVEEKRINAACQILQSKKISINDLAAQIGYHSPHAFRRAFKKVTNLSPAEYNRLSSLDNPH